MAGVAKLFDGHILNKSNRRVDLYDKEYKRKIFGLYFSAHWCPPCRRFTPKLIKFYKKYAEEKKLEIIFISSDDDEESFDEYYEDMPWLKLDYEERKKKEKLTKKYKVDGIPVLVLLDGDSGNILCDDAKDQIADEDPKGEHFPWDSDE